MELNSNNLLSQTADEPNQSLQYNELATSQGDSPKTLQNDCQKGAYNIINIEQLSKNGQPSAPQMSDTNIKQLLNLDGTAVFTDESLISNSLKNPLALTSSNHNQQQIQGDMSTQIVQIQKEARPGISSEYIKLDQQMCVTVVPACAQLIQESQYIKETFSIQQQQASLQQAVLVPLIKYEQNLEGVISQDNIDPNQQLKLPFLSSDQDNKMVNPIKNSLVNSQKQDMSHQLLTKEQSEKKPDALISSAESTQFTFNDSLYTAYRAPLDTNVLSFSGFNNNPQQFACWPALLVIISCAALFVLFYKKYQALKSKYSELENNNIRLRLENEQLVKQSQQNTSLTLAFQSNSQLNKIGQQFQNNNGSNNLNNLVQLSKSKCTHEQCSCASQPAAALAHFPSLSANHSSPLSVSSPSQKGADEHNDSLHDGPIAYIDQLWMMPYGRPRICSYEVQSPPAHQLLELQKSPLQKNLSYRPAYFNTPTRQGSNQYSPIKKNLATSKKDNGNHTPMAFGSGIKHQVNNDDHFSSLIQRSKGAASTACQQQARHHILIEDQEGMQKHEFTFNQNKNEQEIMGAAGQQQTLPQRFNSKWKEDNISILQPKKCRDVNPGAILVTETTQDSMSCHNLPTYQSFNTNSINPAIGRFQEKFNNTFSNNPGFELQNFQQKSTPILNNTLRSMEDNPYCSSFRNGAIVQNKLIKANTGSVVNKNMARGLSSKRSGRKLIPSQFMQSNYTKQQMSNNHQFLVQPSQLKQRGHTLSQSRQAFAMKNNLHIISPQLGPIVARPSKLVNTKASSNQQQNPNIVHKFDRNLFSPPLNSYKSNTILNNANEQDHDQQFQLPQLANLVSSKTCKDKKNNVDSHDIKQEIYSQHNYNQNQLENTLMKNKSTCHHKVKVSRHVSQILSEHNLVLSHEGGSHKIYGQDTYVSTKSNEQYQEQILQLQQETDFQLAANSRRYMAGACGTTDGAEEGDESSFEMYYERYFPDFQVGYNSDDDSNGSNSQSCASQQVENNLMSPVLKHQQISHQTVSNTSQNPCGNLTLKNQQSASPKVKKCVGGGGSIHYQIQSQSKNLIGAMNKRSFKQKRVNNIQNYQNNINGLLSNSSLRKQSAPANFYKSSTSIEEYPPTIPIDTIHESSQQQDQTSTNGNLVYLENGRYKNSFEELSVLGRGGFGVAYKVRHKLDSNFYAIKKVRLHLAHDQDIKDHKVYREIMALPQLNHKNVVRYFGCWAEKIDQVDQGRIEERVAKIKKRLERLPNQKNNNKKQQHIKPLLNEHQQKQMKQQVKKPSQFKLNKDSEFFNMNQLDFNDELDHAFDRPQREKEQGQIGLNNRIKKQSDLNQKQKNKGQQSKSSISDSDVSRASSLSSSEKSYDSEEESSSEKSNQIRYQNEDKSKVDNESQLISDEDFIGKSFNDMNQSNYNSDSEYSKNGNSNSDDNSQVSDEDEEDEDDDDDENTRMNKFDDDALVEFIQQDKGFMTIDLMIQMEYCSGQTLQEYLEQNGRLPDAQENLNYFRQLLSAVRHIHQNGFIHRDLKPANIFIEGQTIKVGDFGLARKFDNPTSMTTASSNALQKLAAALLISGQNTQSYNSQNISGDISNFSNALFSRTNGGGNNSDNIDIFGSGGATIKRNKSNLKKMLARSLSKQSILTTQIGTSTYLSPEQEKNKPYNEKVDIYALGLILCEMCSKFSTLHERISTINDLKYNAKLPSAMLAIYPVESQIILQITDKDAEKRLSAQDLIKSTLLEQWTKGFSNMQIVLNSTISPRDMLESNQSETTVSPQKSHHRDSFDTSSVNNDKSIKSACGQAQNNHKQKNQQNSPIQVINQFKPSQTFKNGIILMSTDPIFSPTNLDTDGKQLQQFDIQNNIESDRLNVENNYEENQNTQA